MPTGARPAPGWARLKRQKKIDGIIEILRSACTDIQVQISHLSKGYDLYRPTRISLQRAASQRTLQVIDDYVARGVRALT